MTPATKSPPRPRTARPATRVHRRVSGPARPVTPRAANGRAATARAAAAPLPVPPLGAISLRVLRAGRSLQDSTLLERLVRGRGWIVLLGALLFGLVALNVSLLKLNAAAGHNAERAKILRIQNAKLRGKVSRLASGDRVRAAAADMGFVMPEAKKLHYLKARPGRDPRQAVRNIRDGTALAGTEDLISATPESESEVLAPTPPQPITESPAPAPAPAVAGSAPVAPANGATAPPANGVTADGAAANGG
jgi:hypothetical protein